MKRPAVVVVTRRTIRKDRYIDYVAEAHLELLLRFGLLPILVPVTDGVAACLPNYQEEMRGLLLVEGEDIEPTRYRARPANRKWLEQIHPLKDEIEIRLLRKALRRKLPVLGICRGSQLLNAVCGGTLYGDVQKEKRSNLKHIDFTNYDGYRHPISVVPGTPLEGWYGRDRLNVNSYHHQGILQLARRFRPMASADDGLIESFYDPKAAFVAGFQFHPERMAEETDGNLRLWKAFAKAVKNQA